MFLAMGGGGDVVLASTLALSYERCGGKSFIGSIAWERYVVDPIPGPIPINSIINAVERGFGYVVVSRDSFALRGGRVVVPQAVNVSRILGKPISVLDLYLGAKGLSEAVKEFADRYGIDVVIGVDVGGDSVAEGYEEDLWSPLADAVVAAALAHIPRACIAVASPGADGELPQRVVEKRLRRIARLGGYIGGYVLSRKDIDVLRHILSATISEASTIPLLVVDTDLDNVSIRHGSRRVELSMLSLAVFILDAVTVVRDSLARYVYDTQSLDEARKILNALNIVTEYDLEEEIFKELLARGSYVELDLVQLRDRLRKKILQHHTKISKELILSDHRDQV